MIALATNLLLTGVSSQAGETYYRWTDENGRPVHSDRPAPKGIDYEVIKTGSGLRRSVDSEEGAVPRSVDPTQNNNFKPVTITKDKIKKNPEFCARAQENLEVLNAKVRIQMRDENGEAFYLTEEDRTFQKKRAQDTIEVHCP